MVIEKIAGAGDVAAHHKGIVNDWQVMKGAPVKYESEAVAVFERDQLNGRESIDLVWRPRDSAFIIRRIH